MVRIFQAANSGEIIRLMNDLKVDPYGRRIMLPKAVSHLLYIESLPAISANILKQEMLSLGGDTAVSRDALTGKTRFSGCLLMGTLAQYQRLSQKLSRQPLGLAQLSRQLQSCLENYAQDKFVLELGRARLNLGRRTHIMGIVNITPDSFSGDGMYGSWVVGHGSGINRIIQFAEKLAQEGADIIDIGGESSRPGAKPVPLKEELRRTIPVVKALAKRIKTPISIDTRKPEVAKAALDNGAAMVNDISGLRRQAMVKVVKQRRAAVVIMHMRGDPRSMQNAPAYSSLIDEIAGFLQSAVRRAQDAGISPGKIVVDPGIGFGKTLRHNLEILKRLGEFRALGRPIMVGPSRKSFLGEILKSGPRERVFGTVAGCLVAAQNGAKIVRVHDVKAVAQALNIFDAVKRNRIGRV